MTIALIPARGGSTRIKRKNLIDVCGVPLVIWSVIQTRVSKKIDEVYVTTDDYLIEVACNRHGADIIRRPVYSDGTCSSVPFLHALKTIEANGVEVDEIVILFPTSPLRKPEDLDNMIEMRRRLNVDFVTPGIPMKEIYLFKNDSPYQDRFGTVKQDKGYTGKQVIYDKFWNYTKAQEGTFVGTRDYFFREWSNSAETDLEQDTRPVDIKTTWNFYPVPEWQFFDIDYPEDLEIVRVLMENYILKGKGPKVYYDYKEGK
ncbi:MAG: hypothetical protein PHX80_03680 [Candidatus Nanoarchaeia archaeon]|nr:hypothetical protein [Candidatus Nanoarchaeia archaeon]